MVKLRRCQFHEICESHTIFAHGRCRECFSLESKIQKNYELVNKILDRLKEAE